MNGTSLVRDMRVRIAAFMAATGLVLYAAVALVSACITVPPPNLPEPPLVSPHIQREAVEPPMGDLLAWPEGSTFIVPVEMDNPTETFLYRVFVDYYDVPPGSPLNKMPSWSGGGPQAPDGGVSLVTFLLDVPPTPTCPHRIDFVVANNFTPGSDRVWDHVGGDIGTWYYYPNGQPFCSDYDSGDGSFPDAAFDGLPIPPETGGGP